MIVLVTWLCFFLDGRRIISDKHAERIMGASVFISVRSWCHRGGSRSGFVEKLRMILSFLPPRGNKRRKE
jgi:hypothetical protein